MARDDQLELIERLCLEAGRITENVSPYLAMAIPEGEVELVTHLDRLAQAADDLTAISRAAKALQRRRVTDERAL